MGLEVGFRAHSICPSQEAALGMDVLTWVSHPSQKELAQTGGFTPALQEGKSNPTWSSLDG